MNILTVRKMQEASRFEILRRDYLEIEYRNRKGVYVTARFHPDGIDDFIAQLNEKRRMAVYRPSL